MSKWIHRGLRYKHARRFWQRLAPLFVVIFAWSSTLAPGAQAYADARSKDAFDASLRNRPLSRHLTPDEMRAIKGAQSGPGISYDSGAAYPWDGKAGDTNTCNGNRQFSVPIVGWTAK